MKIKGWKLMKEVSEGKLNLKQKVSTTSSKYKNCTIEFVLKDIAFNIMDLDFELLQDEIDIADIQRLDEWITLRNGEVTQTEGKILEIGNKVNELVQAVKQLNKKLEEKYNESDVKSTEYYLGKSITAMKDIDALYLCDNWNLARGCRIEEKVAREYGIKILDKKFFANNPIITTRNFERSDT